MNKFKSKKSIALPLLLASAVAVGGAAIALGTSTESAYADYSQSLDGTKIFYTGIRGAEISYSPAETDEDGTTTHVYTTFEIGADETVAYRQNLAYSWLVGNKDDDGNLTGDYESGRFSMEIGFNKADFARYVIKFQSQQYMLTEDGISENYLVFVPTTEGETTKLKIYLVQELDDDTELTDEDLATATTYGLGDHITISFGEYENGNYPLVINGEKTEGLFENVYEPYASYVSSGDTAVTPLTFSATFAEGASEDAVAQMVLYNLNGQTFELKTKSSDSSGNDVVDDDGNTAYETTVLDDTPPVMCFTSTPSYLMNGSEIDLDYKVIDVLGTSTRATAYYYVLTGEQYSSEDYDYDKLSSDYDDDTSPYTEITSSSELKILTDSDTFIPRTYLDNEENVYGLVKIYYKISDRSSSAQSDIVFVDWYAKESALVNVYDLKDEEDVDGSGNFIKLIDDTTKPGLTYAQQSDLTATELPADADDDETDPVLYAYKQTIASFTTAYQNKIDDAIAALEDEDGNVVGKLYAGSDSKFYLPSFDNLTDEEGNAFTFDFADTDEYLNTGDYKFVIYYRAESSGSTSSASLNGLSISLSEASVTYVFKIYISDEFGNSMLYPTAKKNDDDEYIYNEETKSYEIEWEEISTDDIWEDDYYDLIPRFEFYVGYKEATAEAPEDLSIAYVGTSYSGISFTIKGVSDTYSTEYNLYIFDRDAMTETYGVTMDYDTFLANVEKLFNNELDDIEVDGVKVFAGKNADTRQFFKTVKASSDLASTDADYDTFSDIAWNATSITFTPQSVEDYYVVRLTLTDNDSQVKTYSYTAVAASVQATSLKGESDWLENNLVAIILFSAAGVFLIAFVILLLVRPKDKGDIDAVYSEVVESGEGKKAGKAKKSKKAKAAEAAEDAESDLPND